MSESEVFLALVTNDLLHRGVGACLKEETRSGKMKSTGRKSACLQWVKNRSGMIVKRSEMRGYPKKEAG